VSTDDLELGPAALYPAKALLTRARSLVWLSRRRRARPGVRILFYHRVSDERDELAVSPRSFAAQMAAVADAGYLGVSIDDVAAALTNGDNAPQRVVGLSFDDGYRDVAEHALPVLAQHGFTATVFVATGITGGRARFTWYEHQPPLLGWEELRTLDGSSPLRFEAHTVTHPNLRRLDETSAWAEIEECKRELERELERTVTGFAYPAGLFGLRERDLVERAGYAWAVSCEPGVNVATTDRFALRRIQIDARDSLLDFRAKLSGGHDRPLPGRAAYRRLRYG
jgi:peptidoglycan/xylan/chitin deacetylase (PgdA/CDA1 family)